MTSDSCWDETSDEDCAGTGSRPVPCAYDESSGIASGVTETLGLNEVFERKYFLTA